MIYGGVSAVLYTVTNICLRSATHLDPVWVSAVKAWPTVWMVAPILYFRWREGGRVFANRREVAWLVLTAVVVQIFGNVAFQWALGIIGLAITVPLVLGTMLVAGALFGKAMLGEPVTGRKWLAVALLIAATAAISYGAHGQAAFVVGRTVSTWLVVVALAAAIASGFAYALLGTMMRRAMQRGMSLASTLFIFSFLGAVMLTSWAWATIGTSGILATGWRDWVVMLAAGVFNATAFLLMAKSLQQIPVLVVQMLNASQAALAAVAGWFWFAEPVNGWVACGLLLTAAGFLVAGIRPQRTPPIAAAEPVTT
ncbi:MAG: hypothetical protein D6753_08115 [Planctomycetota bacterium]|nr:MAG: hypothetical protein D6753_08115 [Planctomycetota bacterium]